MPLILPTQERFDFGLPSYLESGIVNLLNALNVATFSTDLSGLLSTTNSSTAATANTTAINAALAAGGLVQILTPGTYYINASLAFLSKTQLLMGIGVFLFRYDQTYAPLIKNKYAGYLDKESRLTRASNVATALDFNHKISVGDLVYVRNAADAAFNGLQTVSSVSAGVSWSYTNAGANYSAGSATRFVAFIPVLRSLALASFTANTAFPANATTGYTYVADANNDIRAGFLVFVASVGTVEVVRTDVAGWTYFGAIPTDAVVGLSYAYDISIFGGVLNGNRVNNATGFNGSTESVVVAFGACNNLSIKDTQISGSNLRCIQLNNCQQVELNSIDFSDTLVGAQFEGGGRRLRAINCRGKSAEHGNAATSTAGAQVQDDFLAFTGVLASGGGVYDNVASPYGLVDFDDIKVLNCSTQSSLNGIKITADLSISYDNFDINGFFGGSLDPVPSLASVAGLRIMDDTAQLTGTRVKKLTVKNLGWTVKSGSSASTVNFNTTGSVDDLTLIDCDYSGLNSTSLSPIVINSTGTIKRMLVNGVRWADNASATNGKPFIAQTAGSTVQDLTVANFDITFQSSTAVHNAIFENQSSSITSRLTLRDGLARGNAANVGALYRMIGRLDDITIDNVNSLEATNILACIAFHTRTGGGFTSNTRIRNCDLKLLNGFSNSGAALGTAIANILMSGCTINNAGSNNFLQVDSGVFNVFGGPDNIWVVNSKSAYVGAGTQTFRINCPSMPFDIATLAAKTAGMLNGDQLYNTNAATGTITSAGVLTYQTLAAPKWIMPLTVAGGVPTFATN